MFGDSERAALQAGLRAWYELRRRRLPWREEPTPYRVWVSEIMLQQTQVATVLPYFDRFMAVFPTVEALAEAADADVLTAWSGLGYYRRARNLHAAAGIVVSELGGRVPGTVAGLMALPGIGRYTAGAIASIAFGVTAPVLDGNVARVLSRLVALDLEVDGTAGQKALWALAEALVTGVDPSAHNQALMELGALVCAPKSPDCAACPWSGECAAHRAGTEMAYPKKAAKVAAKAVRAVAGLLVEGADSDRVLMARRPDDVLLGGLWELPGIDLVDGRGRKSKVAGAFRERVGIEIEVGDVLATVTHQFTHRSLTLEVFATRAVEVGVLRPSWYTDARWVSRVSAGDEVPLSTLARKVLSALDGVGSGARL